MLAIAEGASTLPPVATPAGDDDDEQLTAVAAIDRLKLGGGNPKYMFLNYRLHALKQIRGVMTKQEFLDERKELALTYDRSPVLQVRWKRMFKVVHERRQARAAAPAEAATKK